MYTIPLLFDTTRQVGLSESADIALYLDVHYLCTPKVVEEGTRGLQMAFSEMAFAMIGECSRPLWIPLLLGKFDGKEALQNEPSVKYNLERYQVPSSLSDEEREACLNTLKNEMGRVFRWYKHEEDVFISGGDKPMFADFCVGAALMTLRVVIGKDSLEWEAIRSWHGGKWRRVVDALKLYETSNKISHL